MLFLDIWQRMCHICLFDRLLRINHRIWERVTVTAMGDWLRIAFQETVYMRATKVALVVGTILVLINHGDTLLQGIFSAKLLFQIGLTYLVPYGVSTYASVQAIRETQSR